MPAAAAPQMAPEAAQEWDPMCSEEVGARAAAGRWTSSWRPRALAALAAGLALAGLAAVAALRAQAPSEVAERGAARGGSSGVSETFRDGLLNKYEHLAKVEAELAELARPLGKGGLWPNATVLPPLLDPSTKSIVPVRVSDRALGTWGQGGDQAVQTECIIDVIEAYAYLLQAIVFMYKAVNSAAGLQCPDMSQAGCASSVAGFLASISWIGAYLSLAASACADTVNSKALCSADLMTICADLGELAFVGAAVGADCDPAARRPEWVVALEERRAAEAAAEEEAAAEDAAAAADTRSAPAPSAAPAPAHKGGKLLEKLKGLKDKLKPKAASPRRLQADGPRPIADFVNTVSDARNARLDRNFDIVQCHVDVTQSISYLVYSALAIRSASQNCPDPEACTINVLNIISSFSWVSQYTALAVSDCQVGSNIRALCTADISDEVAALTSLQAVTIAATNDCAASPDKAEEVEIQELNRRLAEAAKPGAAV